MVVAVSVSIYANVGSVWQVLVKKQYNLKLKKFEGWQWIYCPLRYLLVA